MKKIVTVLAAATFALVAAGCGGGGGSHNPGGGGDPATYTLSASVSGLHAGNPVEIQNEGADPQSISTDGTVSLASSLASGAAYDVTVTTQPTGQECTVTNGAGTINHQDVTVDVACVDTSNTWKWKSGSSSLNDAGSFGTLTVAAASNAPSSRRDAASGVDGNGNLWLFGGMGQMATFRNDLWKYDGTNWTWMSGSSSANQLPDYGTLGQALPSNRPGARHGAVSWVDGNGDFWLMGGWALDANGQGGYMNDLWRYNATGWLWVGGSNTKDGAG